MSYGESMTAGPLRRPFQCTVKSRDAKQDYGEPMSQYFTPCYKVLYGCGGKCSCCYTAALLRLLHGQDEIAAPCETGASSGTEIKAPESVCFLSG